MHIAHVALWTRSLNAQVQFWETVFNGRSNERYVSKNRPVSNHTLLRWMTGRPSS
jgi:lactoylglutathione lyase